MATPPLPRFDSVIFYINKNKKYSVQKGSQKLIRIFLYV